MSEMSNQNFENNGANGTRPLDEGFSPGRCFLLQQREPDRHQVTARMKLKEEVNKVMIECSYRSKPFDEEGKPMRGYKVCLGNGEIEDCLNQHSNVYVTKQGQLGKMDGYHNLNWKQLKDK